MQQHFKEWKAGLKEAEDLIDGLIETINEDLNWKEVTVNSAKREKFDLMRKLVEGMDEEI